MGRFLETKGWAAGFMLAVLTKIGVVTGGVTATVLTKAEPFFFQNFIYLPIQYTPLTYTIYITLTNTKDAIRVEKRTILTK